MVDHEHFINWLCKNFYDEKTLAHVERVAKHVSLMTQIPEKDREFCYKLAWLHDIVEDNPTKISYAMFSDNYLLALSMLTKNEKETYEDYCKRLNPIDYCGMYPEINKCAWYVKIADMFDHLNQVETLTDRLKEKYLSGLRYLL